MVGVLELVGMVVAIETVLLYGIGAATGSAILSGVIAGAFLLANTILTIYLTRSRREGRSEREN